MKGGSLISHPPLLKRMTASNALSTSARISPSLSQKGVWKHCLLSLPSSPWGNVFAWKLLHLPQPHSKPAQERRAKPTRRGWGWLWERAAFGFAPELGLQRGSGLAEVHFSVNSVSPVLDGAALNLHLMNKGG